MTSGDDPNATIPDDAILWRRVPPVHVTGNRPSSAAFHSGDGLTSVCVAAIARTHDEIMRGHDGFSLVAFTAGDARAAGFEIHVTDGDYVGHADLAWPAGKSASARQRAQKKLAKACEGRWVVKA